MKKYKKKSIIKNKMFQKKINNLLLTEYLLYTILYNINDFANSSVSIHKCDRQKE